MYEKAFNKDYLDKVIFAKTRHDAVENADALILITEWKEFRNPDWQLLKEKLNQPVIFDGRNIYNRKIRELGFDLYQIGC